MPLKYWLSKSAVMSDPDSYRAATKSNELFTLEDVVNIMIRQGSPMTKGEVLNGFEEMTRTIIEILERGNGVITPLFTITPSIAGIFTHNKDSFDPARHKVRFRVKPGESLRDISAKVEVEKIKVVSRSSIVNGLYDYISKTENEVITPGGNGRIVGEYLKFEEADVAQGVFFEKKSTGELVRVSTEFMRNMPGELLFVIPDTLTAGTYRVEVRTILPQGKSVQKGVLKVDLTVA